MCDDPEYWEAILEAEGMPAEPRRRMKRAPRPDADGKRPWLGTYEFPAEVGTGNRMDTMRASDPALGRRSSREYWERPSNPYEALMVAPGDQVEISTEELAELREVMLDAVDALPDLERAVVLEHLLGDSTSFKFALDHGVPRGSVWSIAQRALQHLEGLLDEEPTVMSYLSRFDPATTTEDGA